MPKYTSEYSIITGLKDDYDSKRLLVNEIIAQIPIEKLEKMFNITKGLDDLHPKLTVYKASIEL